MSVLLAIETSQHRGSVAVRLPDGRIDSEPLSQKKRHDDDLLPAIDRLFTRNSLTPADLRSASDRHRDVETSIADSRQPTADSPQCPAVAVSIGPGGFTGLRIAVATAKMFAETLGTKIIAVPSALVAAQGLTKDGQTFATDVADAIDKKKSSRREVPGNPQSDSSATSVVNRCFAFPSPVHVLIALSAKNSTFWLTRVERVDDGWEVNSSHPPGIVNAQSMDLHGIAAMLADEHLPADARARCERENIPIVAPVFHAANVISVALRMQARGEFTDPLHLLPLYPRQPEAVTIWEQKKREK